MFIIAGLCLIGLFVFAFCIPRGAQSDRLPDRVVTGLFILLLAGGMLYMGIGMATGKSQLLSPKANKALQLKQADIGPQENF